MTQKSLSTWLKAVILGIAFCGVILCVFLLPAIGKDIVAENPEFSSWYYPWFCVLWIAAVPCYLALYHGWKITVEIGRNRSFSMENAIYLKRISMFAIADTAYFFLANLLLIVFKRNHPGIFIASLFVDFAGVVIAVVAAALSHLVQKAAKMQQENDLTI
ncbi:DUF2975 domain-containing protein [Lachnospiraceae bacterium]|nr:DUF2975 domain-containing protein [Lachnospiraceae bacterium]